MITDAIQMLIIIFSCLATIGFILWQLPVPLGDAIERLSHDGLLRLWNFSPNLADPVTTWSALIGALLSGAAMYLGDQMSLQRYMTSSSMAEVRSSFRVNAFGVAAILILLALIGVCLGIWTRFGENIPENPDQVFLTFVSTQLPPGLAGLMIAALLAATMSSMTSGINALSGAIEMDFAPRFLVFKSEAAKLNAARVLSLAIGVGSTFAAGLVAQLGQIFEIAQRILGVFGGPIAVVVVFAVLPFRISAFTLILAQGLGLVAGSLAALSPQINRLWSDFPVIGAMWTAPIAIFATVLICSIGLRIDKPETLR